jgi:hypothetical protein
MHSFHIVRFCRKVAKKPLRTSFWPASRFSHPDYFLPKCCCDNDLQRSLTKWVYLLCHGRLDRDRPGAQFACPIDGAAQMDRNR